MSYVFTPVPRELLEALAAEAPAPAVTTPTPSPSANGHTNGTGAYTSRLLVERWLTDRRVAYRVKAEPDGKGRTVYVLKACPFDATHGDPDSCVMQAPDGKLSAQCFHASCQGRGWQHFKQALGPPAANHYDPPLSGRQGQRGQRASAPRTASGADPVPPPQTEAPQPKEDGPVAPAATCEVRPAEPAFPCIQGNKRQLRFVTRDALDALRAANNPPTLFQRGEVLTRLRFGDEGAPLLEPLTDHALRGVLARCANWTHVKDTSDGQVVEDDAPPMEAVKDLASLPAWDGIPYLRGVVECPVFVPPGDLVIAPGYHPCGRLWHHPAPDLQLDVPALLAEPDAGAVEWARDTLLVELLGDFPFADDASRAHALSALLLPFVRPLIDGPTPLHLLDAPTEGTGKTLLATAITIVATGREAEAVAEAADDEEWRKRITAVLAEGPTFVLLDNLNRTLDTGALAAALTARVWKDRILGVSKTARLPVGCVWLASGNNARLSRELIRRTLWCRIDAKTDAPWERREFRHPKLIAWAKANRTALVTAAVTLVRAWLAAGRPKGEATLGMFEEWAEVIGGILLVAGVPGLLGNSRQFRAARADQVAEWRAFVTAWWQRHADAAVRVEDLFELVTREKLLDSVLGDKGERSQRTRLGLALSKAADRVVAGYQVEAGEEDHSGRQRYRLRRTDAAPGSDIPQ
jgi:putative DNA primase/helicase